MSPHAALFEAASPREQDGRPPQPARHLPEEIEMGGRSPSVSADTAPGSLSAITPAEAHRGAPPTAEHGAIRGNPAAGSLRTFWLICTISLGLATIVKTAQVALTPDLYAALAGACTRLLASSGFGFLVAATACVWLLALSAAAWDRAQRRYDESRAACGEPMREEDA